MTVWSRLQLPPLRHERLEATRAFRGRRVTMRRGGKRCVASASVAEIDLAAQGSTAQAPSAILGEIPSSVPEQGN